MTTVTQTPYLRLHTDHAPKLAARAMGGVTYEVLSNPEKTQLFIIVVANDGGGNWNREVVSLQEIEKALKGQDKAPFPSRIFRGVFRGRSSNNAGFLAAVLAKEGLLAPAPEVKHKLALAGDWAAWQSGLLSKSGESILIPPVLPEAATKAPAKAPGGKPIEASATPAVTRKDRRGKRGEADALPAAGGDDAGAS